MLTNELQPTLHRSHCGGFIARAAVKAHELTLQRKLRSPVAGLLRLLTPTVEIFAGSDIVAGEQELIQPRYDAFRVKTLRTWLRIRHARVHGSVKAAGSFVKRHKNQPHFAIILSLNTIQDSSKFYTYCR